MSNWIKCSDRLPTHNFSVLGVIVDDSPIADEPYVDVCCYINGIWMHGLMDVDGRCSDIPVSVTYWQPLPNLPKEYAQEKI